MHIRSYDEEAKYLGFKDENEMNLYYDVCGVDIVPAYTREDMLSQCTVGNETLGRTKEDFIKTTTMKIKRYEELKKNK